MGVSIEFDPPPTPSELSDIGRQDIISVDKLGSTNCANTPTMAELYSVNGGHGTTGPPKPWNANVGCADWKASQWVAEYKKVPFAVESDSRTGGRRIQVHEFPSREYWENEDLGRLRQQIDVQAFVFGDESDAWSEELFVACTSPGSGMLFLPMRVPLRATCMSVESSFRSDQMGRIDFTMNFTIEPPNNKGMLHKKYYAKTQLQKDAQEASKTVTKNSRQSYEVNSTGTPQVAHSTTAEFIRQVGNSLRTAARAARLTENANTEIDFIVNRMLTEGDTLAVAQRSVPNTLNRTAATIAQRPPGINYFPVAGSGVALRASTGEVVPQQGGANEGFGGLFEQAMKIMAEGAKDNPGDLAQALIPLTNFTPTILRAMVASSGITASIKAEVQMVEALAAFVRRVSLVNSINAGIRVTPERQPDASLTRKRLLDQIDEEIAIASFDNPNVRDSLITLRAAVVRFVAHFSIGGAAAVTLPKGWSNRPLATVAANAYVHGAVADRDAELMRFNGVTHPLFPTGTLDALNDRSMQISSDVK